MIVAGVDPGNNGAIAIYCSTQRKLLQVEDLPFWFQTVGKKKRRRLDPVALLDLFDVLHMSGVELVVLEAVGGRPRQSASAGFVFGYTVGLIYMACMARRLPVETVPPAKWKKLLDVPGKKGTAEQKKKINSIENEKERNKSKRAMLKSAEGDIMKRIVELFPDNQDMFRTPRGAYRMDRADAALLAKFGGDFVARTLTAVADEELALAYRMAETGA